MNTIISWVHHGADQGAYDRTVRPIINDRCLVCHNGSNPHIPNLDGYDNIKKVTESDTGAKISTLVRVSHIHMFGVPFIFFIMGVMFSNAYVRPVWFKCTVIALPFLAVMVDVASWYIIKIYHPFAWVEILAGMVLAGCFAFMWVVTMYQLWFSPLPAMVAERLGGDIPELALSGVPASPTASCEGRTGAVARKVSRAFSPSAGGAVKTAQPRNTPDRRLSVARAACLGCRPTPVRLRQRDLQDRRAANRQSPRKRVPMSIIPIKTHSLIYINARSLSVRY